MEQTIWYAVNKRGQGLVFVSEPDRVEHFGTWKGNQVGCVSMLVMTMEAEGFELPVISWKDEPVKLKLKLEYG